MHIGGDRVEDETVNADRETKQTKQTKQTKGNDQIEGGAAGKRKRETVAGHDETERKTKYNGAGKAGKVGIKE